MCGSRAAASSSSSAYVRLAGCVSTLSLRESRGLAGAFARTRGSNCLRAQISWVGFPKKREVYHRDRDISPKGTQRSSKERFGNSPDLHNARSKAYMLCFFAKLRRAMIPIVQKRESEGRDSRTVPFASLARPRAQVRVSRDSGVDPVGGPARSPARPDPCTLSAVAGGFEARAKKRPPFGDRQVASTLSTRCPYAIVRRRGTCPSGRSRWGTSRSRRPSRCSRRPGRGSRCRRRGRRCCCRPPCKARRERPRRAWRA